MEKIGVISQERTKKSRSDEGKQASQLQTCFPAESLLSPKGSGKHLTFANFSNELYYSIMRFFS